MFFIESNSLLLKNGSFFLSFVLSFCKSNDIQKKKKKKKKKITMSINKESEI